MRIKTKLNWLALGRSKGLQKKKRKERKKAFARIGYRSPLSVAAAGLLPQAEAQLPAGLGGFEFALIVPLL